MGRGMTTLPLFDLWDPRLHLQKGRGSTESQAVPTRKRVGVQTSRGSEGPLMLLGSPLAPPAAGIRENLLLSTFRFTCGPEKFTLAKNHCPRKLLAAEAEGTCGRQSLPIHDHRPSQLSLSMGVSRGNHHVVLSYEQGLQ